MIRISDIYMPPEHDSNQLWFEAAKALRISGSKIRKLSIVRRSIDARKKPDVRIVQEKLAGKRRLKTLLQKTDRLETSILKSQKNGIIKRTAI